MCIIASTSQRIQEILGEPNTPDSGHQHPLSPVVLSETRDEPEYDDEDAPPFPLYVPNPKYICEGEKCCNKKCRHGDGRKDRWTGQWIEFKCRLKNCKRHWKRYAIGAFWRLKNKLTERKFWYHIRLSCRMKITNRLSLKKFLEKMKKKNVKVFTISLIHETKRKHHWHILLGSDSPIDVDEVHLAWSKHIPNKQGRYTRHFAHLTEADNPPGLLWYFFFGTKKSPRQSPPWGRIAWRTPYSVSGAKRGPSLKDVAKIVSEAGDTLQHMPIVGRDILRGGVAEKSSDLGITHILFEQTECERMPEKIWDDLPSDTDRFAEPMDGFGQIPSHIDLAARATKQWPSRILGREPLAHLDHGRDQHDMTNSDLSIGLMVTQNPAPSGRVEIAGRDGEEFGGPTAGRGKSMQHVLQIRRSSGQKLLSLFGQDDRLSPSGLGTGLLDDLGGVATDVFLDHGPIQGSGDTLASSVFSAAAPVRFVVHPRSEVTILHILDSDLAVHLAEGTDVVFRPTMRSGSDFALFVGEPHFENGTTRRFVRGGADRDGYFSIFSDQIRIGQLRGLDIVLALGKRFLLSVAQTTPSVVSRTEPHIADAHCDSFDVTREKSFPSCTCTNHLSA